MIDIYYLFGALQAGMFIFFMLTLQGQKMKKMMMAAIVAAFVLSACGDKSGVEHGELRVNPDLCHDRYCAMYQGASKVDK